MTKTNFPLEKILNVTPTEYCASAGRDLKGYELQGVYVESESYNLLLQFRGAIPLNAEVVVNYRTNNATSGSFWGSFIIREAHGTALIPKSE